METIISIPVKFENGVREFPINETHNMGPGINGFSNYLCDVCGCILEKNERPFFMSNGNLACEECYNR